MKLLLLMAADYANITGDGKLNVIGIFNDINAFNFPARHPSMHLVARLGAEPEEYGQTRSFTGKLRATFPVRDIHLKRRSASAQGLSG